MGFGFLGMAKILLVVQAAFASITGTVRDGESGEPVAAAVVTLTDVERSVVTDGEGRYVFGAVPAGPHHVAVRRIGYAARTLHALVPRDGVIEINVALRPEPITLEAIAARVAVPVRGLDDGDSTAFPDRGLSMGAVREHPLLAEPDVLQALGGGEVGLRPESPSGIHVRGGASDQVAYLLDGIPVFSPYHAAGSFSAWNADALSRLRLETSAPASGLPDALSGVVSATTRAPGAQARTQGSISTTQARVTIDGPLGRDGAGFLFSTRSGFPGFPAPQRESSYLRGETGDWLAKLESRLFGGRIRVLGYGRDTEIEAAAVAVPEGAGASGIARNVFVWRSRSAGGEWTRQLDGVAFQIRAWHALGDAGAVWSASDSAPRGLTAQRRDAGLLAAVHMSGGQSRTAVGVRTQWSSTAYRVAFDSGVGGSWALRGRTPVSAAFVQHARSLGVRTELELALVGAVAAGTVHLSPRAQLRWSPSTALSVSGGYARLHQFAQSLRNAESVVGTVFPVDLYVGVGSPGVPVARSDQGLVALEYRPTAGTRVGAQAYARDFDGLLLVAPRDGDPFATSGFVVGSGTARGASLDVGLQGARYGVVASYGVQRVRLEHGAGRYVPEHGATHSIDAGVIVYPAATFSLRLGASSVLGRRATALDGPFEWEACNLLDRGCEFAGSPHYRPEALGATPLPAYFRVDLGIRKHWHLNIAGRDGQIAVFGTVTNLFGRRNFLTVAPDAATGERAGVEMRPRAPLVVGIDWRF
ncbi:MAG: TonB-dependent receptor [Gemmatimonadales bacterium]